MARLARLFIVVVVAMVVSPAYAATSRPAHCSGFIRSGKHAACSASVYVSHFNARDAIDYSSLIARIDSPNAASWRVTGTLTDSRGVTYFAWYCSADRSSVSMKNEAYVGHSCAAWRKLVNARRNGHTYTTYYTADTSKPQQLHVAAQVASCVGNPLRGCRFVAKAVYKIS